MLKTIVLFNIFVETAMHFFRIPFFHSQECGWKQILIYHIFYFYTKRNCVDTVHQNVKLPLCNVKYLDKIHLGNPRFIFWRRLSRISGLLPMPLSHNILICAKSVPHWKREWDGENETENLTQNVNRHIIYTHYIYFIVQNRNHIYILY